MMISTRIRRRRRTAEMTPRFHTSSSRLWNVCSLFLGILIMTRIPPPRVTAQRYRNRNRNRYNERERRRRRSDSSRRHDSSSRDVTAQKTSPNNFDRGNNRDRDDGGDFAMQRLGVPFKGQHTGVAVFDLNGDGYLDLLFSSGRHWVDQSYVLMNLGIDPQDPQQYRFSDEFPIGQPGGYYQVDASPLSSLPVDNAGRIHTAVLLAGSVCTVPTGNEFGACEIGRKNPALVLDVVVEGCYVDDANENSAEETGDCRVTWQEVWREPKPQGNRNGAFAQSLGDGTDPAIVLVGAGGISIYEPEQGRYDLQDADLVILPDDHLPVVEDEINRSAGLATGYLGRNWPGIVVGPRTLRNVYPAPLIAVYKYSAHDYDYYDFGDSRYSGNLRKAPQPSGLALTDLNGDGNTDIVEANYLDPYDIEDGYDLDQNFYLLNADGEGRPRRVFGAPLGGRSVDTGMIYNDSPYPDLAFGDSNGNVVLFANLGNDQRTGRFLGFQRRDSFSVSDAGCEVRDIKIASLSACSVSILAAITCLNGEVWGERQNSNRAIHRIDPTGSSCSIPTPEPPSSSSQRTTAMPPPSQPAMAPALNDGPSSFSMDAGGEFKYDDEDDGHSPPGMGPSAAISGQNSSSSAPEMTLLCSCRYTMMFGISVGALMFLL